MNSWKIVQGFPDYEISSNGEIRRLTASHKNPAGYLLALRRNNDGYACVALFCHGQRRDYKLHVLVALHFLPAPLPGQILVRHLDDDKDNNRKVNLAWGTHGDNKADAIRNGKHATGDTHGSRTRPDRRPRGEANGKSVLNDAVVREIRAASGTHRAIADKFGTHHSVVGRIKRLETWGHVR